MLSSQLLLLLRVTAALALVVGGTIAAAPAQAANPGGRCEAGSCDVYVPGVRDPGGPENGGRDGNGGRNDGSGTQPVANNSQPQTEEALCAALGGTWVTGSNGRFGVSEPSCLIPDGDPSDPADPTSAPTVTPAQVAAAARDRISITGPQVGTAPCRDADCKGAVGVPVWLWAEDGFPTRSASASAGGLTVSVTAKMSKVEWNMGDGNVVRCSTPGTAFKESMGFRDSPDCGHRYSKTGTYTVRATAYWDVTFSGAYSASTTVPAVSDAQLQIGEYQVLVSSG